MSRAFPIRPFRFGVQASNAPDAVTWRDLAQRTEAAGFDVLTMPDHFGEQLAPVPALMAAADATTTLRVGGLVWDNDYKHPVVLAKEMATIDVLSGGRLEVGIGAGWMRSDYDQAGLPYDRPGVRIDRFLEGLQVIKGAFGEGPFDFAGTHYRITGYNGLPKPVQKQPPILIGGGGPRMLRIAARHADIVGINGQLHEGVVGPEAIESMTAAAVEEKVDIVCEAAGDRIVDIELNVRAFFVSVTDDRGAVGRGIGDMLGVEPASVLDSPFAIVGTTDQIIEQLRARRERWGFSYIIVGPEDIDPMTPVVAALKGT